MGWGMGRENPFLRPTNEQCPKGYDGQFRDPLNGRCRQCDAQLRLGPPIPQVTEVKPLTEIIPDPWQPGVGLLDGILDRRRMPTKADSVMRFMVDEDYREGYKAGIDAAMDLLVPALKAVVLLGTFQNTAGTYSKADVDKIIGRVPLKRTLKGWE